MSYLMPTEADYAEFWRGHDLAVDLADAALSFFHDQLERDGFALAVRAAYQLHCGVLPDLPSTSEVNDYAMARRRFDELIAVQSGMLSIIQDQIARLEAKAVDEERAAAAARRAQAIQQVESMLLPERAKIVAEIEAAVKSIPEYRAMPPVKYALEHDPKSPIATHYASLVGLLEQIETRDVPRAAVLYEPVQKILAQQALTPAGRVDVLFRYMQIRDRVLLGLGQ